MEEFAEKIYQTLQANGFPAKRVSLPTEKMFETAETKGFSFNAVLEFLKTKHQVEAKIGADKIIFSSAAAKLDPQDMMKQAQEMMAKMSPDELRKIQDLFKNMSPEEKDEMMKKGKDLGIL